MTSPAQRDANLRLANIARLHIAAVKAEIRQLDPDEGRRRAAEVVREPGLAGAVHVGVLLRSIRLLGPGQRVARHAGVSRDQCLRDLTDHQRDMLAFALCLPHTAQLDLPADREEIIAERDALEGIVTTLRAELRKIREAA